MDDSTSNKCLRVVPADSPAGPDRRRFLGNVVKAAGGLLLGDLAGVTAATAQTPRRRRSRRRNSPTGDGRSRTNRSPRSRSNGCRAGLVAAQRRVDRRGRARK